MNASMNRVLGSRLAFAMVAAVGIGAAATASHAAIVSYTTTLSGANEAPPNGSPATGFAQVDIDRDAHTMRVMITFDGLTAANTACHIHAPTAIAGAGTAGVATTTPTFTGFPTGTTSGVYDHTFDMTLASSYNAAFLTAQGGTPASAEAAFWLYLHQGRTYVNLHTSAFPGGEIRGFLVPTPGGAALLGLAGLMAAGRRRR